MKDEIYTVVSTGEGAYIERMTKGELIERLNEGCWGDEKVHSTEDFGEGAIDLMATRGVFIIKGDVVVPKPIAVVKEYDI
jgi:hypothetical protein